MYNNVKELKRYRVDIIHRAVIMESHGDVSPPLLPPRNNPKKCFPFIFLLIYGYPHRNRCV